MIDIPGVRTRIALLDIPGTDSATPVRVFLHGLGSSSIATFPEIVAHPTLRHSRSILIDLPGFGYSNAESKVTKSASRNATTRFSSGSVDSDEFDIESQAKAVARILEHLELSHAHVIGHSMGGSIAVSLAYVRPDLVSHLTVAEPNLDPGHGTLSTHIIRRTETAFVEVGYSNLVRGMQQQALRGEGNAAVFLGTLLQASPLAMYRAAASLLAERTPTFRDQFIHARMPRTFIAGETSNDILASDLIPHGIRFIEIPNTGHVMMDDKPEAFAEAIASREGNALS